MAEINSIEVVTAFRRRQRSRGGKRWMVDGASVDLDFVNQRYWWNGALRSSSEFIAFTGGTFSGGLVLDGIAANSDIRIAWPVIGLAYPFSIHASWTPAAIGALQTPASVGNITVANIIAVNASATNQASFSVITASATVADIVQAAAASVGVRMTVGGLAETNNIIGSLNGATMGTLDTSATLPTESGLSALRIGKRVGGTGPLNGTIHRVTLFSGSKSQAQLNAENALVHAT